MQTNIKATAGSQGTLFQGGHASASGGGQPWPRRYSPERQQEIREAVHPATKAAYSGSPGVRAILGTVMRSTVPAHQVQGVKFQEESSYGRNKGVAGGTIVGSYSPQLDRNNNFERYGSIKVSPGQVHADTPIHELGHHVSSITGRPSSAYNTVARKGADEGFAETFSENHYRDRRGRPDTNFQTSPANWSAGLSTNSQVTFAKHFNKERIGAPSVVRADAAKQESVKNTRGGLLQGQLFYPTSKDHQSPGTYFYQHGSKETGDDKLRPWPEGEGPKFEGTK
jgi:hypothetical protein